VSRYTGCPTRYQIRHFFNNFTTNEDIATKFEADLPHCVRSVKEKNVLLFKFRCNIFLGVRIIKKMPGWVASGTLCIMNSVALEWRLRPPLRFPPVCIIPSMLHTHLQMHVACTRRTNGRKLGTIHSEIGKHWIKTNFIFFYKNFSVLYVIKI
jgi:hypothetical protein